MLTLPSSLVARLPGASRIRAWPVPLPLPPVVVSLVWHERTLRDPAHQWVRERLASLGAMVAQ